MFYKILGLVVLGSLAISCASLRPEKSDKLTIETTSLAEIKQTDSKAATGLAPYSYKNVEYKAEWLSCSVEKPKATLLVMHRDKSGYDAKNFCQGWIAQTFLNAGFDIIAINRPGFAKSTGKSDFAGSQSIMAIHKGLEAALKKTKLKPPVGIWGYSSGATVAALASREMTDLKFLLLGGGIYDLEETLEKTKDKYVKKEISMIQKTGGDEAIEDRSIAYDVSGLPKRVAIYHGKQDKTVLPEQAEMFRDSLQSSEYKATLQIIDGVSHEIPVRTHQKILQVLAISLL